MGVSDPLFCRVRIRLFFHASHNDGPRNRHNKLYTRPRPIDNRLYTRPRLCGFATVNVQRLARSPHIHLQRQHVPAMARHGRLCYDMQADGLTHEEGRNEAVSKRFVSLSLSCFRSSARRRSRQSVNVPSSSLAPIINHLPLPGNRELTCRFPICWSSLFRRRLLWFSNRWAVAKA